MPTGQRIVDDSTNHSSQVVVVVVIVVVVVVVGLEVTHCESAHAEHDKLRPKEHERVHSSCVA
jgi:hypothetical protein